MARVANLEQAIQVAVECQNQNAEAFRDALYALEVRHWVMMRASDDLANGSVEKTPDGGINWSFYEVKYRSWWEAQQSAEKNTSSTLANSDDPVIFGGS